MRITKQHVAIALACGALGVFAVGLIGLVALGVMMETQVLPDSACLRGDEVRAAHVAWLREQGIVPDGEELQWFYSADLLSIERDGNLFTDRRIVSYVEDEGELYVYETSFEEVADLRVEWGGFLDDTVVVVEEQDGEWYELLVSTESGLDRVFVEDLRARLDGAAGGGASVDPELDDR